MSENKYLGLAAQAWCDKTTEHITMIPELAEVFAAILKSERQKVVDRFKELNNLPLCDPDCNVAEYLFLIQELGDE